MIKTAKYLSLILSFALFILSCGKEDAQLYEGLPLKTWVDRLESPDPDIRMDALKVIGSIGIKARVVEDYIRDLASDERIPEVKMEAIKTLESMKVRVIEFNDFIDLYNAPLNPFETDELDENIVYDSDLEFQEDTDNLDELEMDEEFLQHASGDDDLEYLKMIASGQLDLEDIDTSSISNSSGSGFSKWLPSEQTNEISNLLNMLNNPVVLRELLNSGDELTRDFALKKLGVQSGSVDGMKELLTELLGATNDTSVVQAAEKALKNWK